MLFQAMSNICVVFFQSKDDFLDSKVSKVQLLAQVTVYLKRRKQFAK